MATGRMTISHDDEEVATQTKKKKKSEKTERGRINEMTWKTRVRKSI